MKLPTRLGYTRREVLTFLLGIIVVYAFLAGWLDVEIGF